MNLPLRMCACESCKVAFQPKYPAQRFCSIDCGNHNRKKSDEYAMCQREGCENVFQLRRPSERGKRKFCSQRCNGMAYQRFSKEAMDRGRAKGIVTHKRKVLARIDGLTPLEAFKLGYQCGQRTKHTRLRAKYLLVKKPERAA